MMLKQNSDEVWPASQRSWQGGGREVKKAHPDAGGSGHERASAEAAAIRREGTAHGLPTCSL